MVVQLIFSTTIQNFPRMSDLLSEVSMFQHNTVYSPNVAPCRWLFTCDWGRYFKHWSHSSPFAKPLFWAYKFACSHAAVISPDCICHSSLRAVLFYFGNV